MKKKQFILGLIIIIILGIFFNIEFGNYYNTPEEALKHNNFDDTSMKNIVETVWVQDQPVIFYVSNNGDFCKMEFKKKEIFGRTGWKSATIGILEAKNINPNVLIPTEMATADIYPSKMLFGITKSAKANTIKINGKSPTFKQFEIKGDNYVLWYIIGDPNQLDLKKVKITSD